jgi:4-alpha-glucanotransferase
MSDQFPRSSGILLHVTSLPGPYGIGDLGPDARDFVDKLVAAKQRYWQVLPLGPTGFADSPYQCLSTFAGNTNLISLDELVAENWLTPDDVANRPSFSARWSDYAPVIAWHDEMLTLAYERFAAHNSPQAYTQWCADNAWWLEDFVLYIALKERHGGKPWVEWPQAEGLNGGAAAEAARHDLRKRIAEHRFRQWLFFAQWTALRQYVNGKGIRIIGDLPIYVAHDSSDVWVHRDLFDLDAQGYPRCIAGVPPDSFSVTGQRWGNPLYVWSKHQETGYEWWIKRIDAAFALVDVLRIDHFRGFDRYWAIPAGDLTAERGQWQPGPGRSFFEALGAERISRIIAEDLGDDLGGAIELRDSLNLPGMIVLHFAFSGTPPERERFRPGKPGTNFIVYTGTHDNNTTLGWWQDAITQAQRDEVLRHTASYGISDPNWALIRLGMDYAAHTFIAPLQDILGLGTSARMNTPSVPSGNWRWRCTSKDLQDADWQRLRAMTEQARRAPDLLRQ